MVQRIPRDLNNGRFRINQWRIRAIIARSTYTKYYQIHWDAHIKICANIAHIVRYMNISLSTRPFNADTSAVDLSNQL